MRLGEKQVLTVVKKVDFGVYLGSDEERVLLPKKQVPEEIEVGDPVEVFLYKDSSDRMIATTKEPKLTLGNLAVLEVVDVGRIGAFLDWGLEKDFHGYAGAGSPQILFRAGKLCQDHHNNHNLLTDFLSESSTFSTIFSDGLSAALIFFIRRSQVTSAFFLIS